MTKQIAPIRQATENENVKTLPIGKTAETTAEEKKAVVLATIEKFKPKPPTADERINRIAQFEALSKRYNLLKEKSNDLKMFEAGNDKTNAKIIFKNSQGFEFDIRNSNVIEKLQDAAFAELNILLSEAENEVLTFEI